jgi:Tfp pilus assembly protein PilV
MMNFHPISRSRQLQRAFSLLEVLIASAIFFMAIFSILALVSNSLRGARLLQAVEVDASMLAAELSATNKLSEGTENGDFGKEYRDYSWRRAVSEVGSNGLFQVDFVVEHRPTRRETVMSVLFYRPESGPAGGVRLGR